MNTIVEQMKIMIDQLEKKQEEFKKVCEEELREKIYNEVLEQQDMVQEEKPKEISINDLLDAFRKNEDFRDIMIKEIFKDYSTEQQLKKIDLVRSNIKACIIKDGKKVISSGESRYARIFVDVMKAIKSHTEIANNCSANFSSDKQDKGVKGYRYVDGLELAYQGKDSNGTLQDIIQLVKYKKYTMYLEIELQDGRRVYFKN